MMNGKLSCGVLMSLACMTLGQGLSSCVFSVRGHTTEGNDRHRDGGESAEDPKQARRMRKVEEAELKLALARRAADDGLVEARQDLVEARHAWEEARLALEHFQYRAKPQRIAGRQLGVDRARFEVANDRLELQQLEADYERYGKEHYAKLTQEIVVSRAKAKLGFTERRLVMEEGELASTQEHVLPAQRRALERAVAAARVGLERAEGALERAELATELEVHRARSALDEARLALDEGDDCDCDDCSEEGNDGERDDEENED